MAPNPSSKTITEWMEIFSKLYSEPDSRRTPEQLWIAVMAHSSSIGECIRRFHFSHLLHFAAHTFCWLGSFVNRCNAAPAGIFSLSESFAGVVSLKYPLACGHCQATPCKCYATKMDAKDDKAAHYEKLLKKREGIIKSVEDYSIEQWKNVFTDIYGEQVHVLALDSIGFHFLEEVGEGATAVRKLSQLTAVTGANISGVNADFLKSVTTVEGIVENYKKYKKVKIDYESKEPDMIKWRIAEAKMSLVIEIADTFSWFCSILNKLHSIAKNSGYSLPSLEEQLKKEYFDDAGKARCPTCKKESCDCVFFS